MSRTSLLGRESSRSSETSYGYERGVEQNNNYSMTIFEVVTNVVAEGYVRKIIIPMVEVGTNVVTKGYVRST